MNKQLTINSNISRCKKLEFKTNFRIKLNEVRELLTKSGNIVKVERTRRILSGVGSCEFYILTHFNGSIIKPMTKKGIINFLNKN